MSRLKMIALRSIIILSFFSIIFPIVVMFIWSFSNNYRYPNLLPDSFGIRGWMYLIENRSRVFMTLRNSFFISISTTVLTILISIPCAKALAFEKFKFKKLVELMVISPVFIPPISIGMGLNIQFIKLGIARTYLGVILVSVVPCIPYAVNMIKDVFLIIGDEYSKQAQTLGASRFYIFYKIIFPMILPGIISASMMCYIVSFSQYFLIYLIGGGRIITLTMDMFPFIQSGDRMMGSVYGIIFILSTIISLIVMEYIMKKIYKKDLEDYVYV